MVQQERFSIPEVAAVARVEKLRHDQVRQYSAVAPQWCLPGLGSSLCRHAFSWSPSLLSSQPTLPSSIFPCPKTPRYRRSTEETPATRRKERRAESSRRLRARAEIRDRLSRTGHRRAGGRIARCSLCRKPLLVNLQKGELGLLIEAAQDVLLAQGLQLHLTQGFQLVLFGFCHGVRGLSGRSDVEMVSKQ